MEVANDFNFGFSAVYDQGSGTLKDLVPQFVYTGEIRNYSWMRADIDRKLLMFGCDPHKKDYFRHSYEAIVGYGPDYKGFMGKPISLRSGVYYKLSNETELSTQTYLGENYSLSWTFQHQLNKNLTVSATQSFDSENAKKAGLGNGYHAGFSAQYKL